MVDHVQLAICFLLHLLAYLWIGQINGQSSTIDYSAEDAAKIRCLLRNRGRQRAISKCFAYYTTSNCSLLSRHMQCYIREKKRICEVEGNSLINGPFGEMLKQKFIRHLTTGCGPFLLVDLPIYACRDCTLSDPKIELDGDTAQIKTNLIETEHSCLQTDVLCHPDSDLWKSRMTIGLDSTQHPYLSPDFGKPVVARLSCNLRPNIWHHNYHPVRQIICDSKAIARTKLDYGCGLCRLDTVPIRMTGDQMGVIPGRSERGCANLTIACGLGYLDYWSQLKINNKEEINGTLDDLFPTIVVTCTDAHDQWIRVGANASNETITDLHCKEKAFPTRDLDIPCGRCSQQKPKIQIIGATTEASTSQGCKAITVTCTPRNTDWISQMEIEEGINGQSKNKTINSTDPGDPIEFRVYCPLNETDWRDERGRNITSVKCTDNAYPANVLRDGCGTCSRRSLQIVHDVDATYTVSEDFTPTGGCRRLKFQCNPLKELDANWTANDDPSTTVKAATSLPVFQTLVCQDTSNGPLWKIENSATYTAGISKLNCRTRFTQSGFLPYGCGACQEGDRKSWSDIQSSSTRRIGKGCKFAELVCSKAWMARAALIIFNQEHIVRSEDEQVVAGIACTSPNPDGLSGRATWTFQDQQQQPILIHTLRCDENETPTPCRTCRLKPPALNLTGIEYYGSFPYCLRLTLNCYSDSPAYRSRLTIGIDSSLSDVGSKLVSKEIDCTASGWVYGSNPITEAHCEPRAVSNVETTKHP